MAFSPTPIKGSQIAIETISPGTSELWFVLEYSIPAMTYIENARIYNSRGVTYYDDITYSVEV